MKLASKLYSMTVMSGDKEFTKNTTKPAPGELGDIDGRNKASHKDIIEGDLDLGASNDKFYFGNKIGKLNGDRKVDMGSGEDTIVLGKTIEDYIITVDKDNNTITIQNKDADGNAKGAAVTFAGAEKLVFKNIKKVDGTTMDFDNSDINVSRLFDKGSDKVVENAEDLGVAKNNLAKLFGIDPARPEAGRVGLADEDHNYKADLDISFESGVA